MDLWLSQSEENYLKSIFRLEKQSVDSQISTNAIAEDLSTKASSVTEMIKKLSEKSLINYAKYKGASLTSLGTSCAVKVIRKHRLWETFLVDKLQFTWDEVHEIAEQLEHIQSEKLTNRLSEFLGNPQFDPHGDPIPDKNGDFPVQHQTIALKDLQTDDFGVVQQIKLDDKAFLLYLTDHDIKIGSKIQCVAKFDFDGSMAVIINDHKEVNLSKKVIKNITVK